MDMRTLLMAKAMAGGSGGGGVSSWNDLTDKPFGEEVEEVVLFDGTAVYGDTLTTEYSVKIQPFNELPA